jgi:hypothetical protein
MRILCLILSKRICHATAGCENLKVQISQLQKINELLEKNV